VRDAGERHVESAKSDEDQQIGWIAAQEAADRPIRAHHGAGRRSRAPMRPIVAIAVASTIVSHPPAPQSRSADARTSTSGTQHPQGRL